MKQNERIWIAASACGLAAALLFIAGFVSTQRERPAAAIVSIASESSSPSTAGDSSSGGESYLVKEYGGQVCIFEEGEALPLRNTGIYTATLPDEDQTRLKDGITVKSQEELSSLLEDYGY